MSRFRRDGNRLVSAGLDADEQVERARSVRDVHRAWVAACAEGGRFMPLLNRREQGQLKHLVRRVGSFQLAGRLLVRCARDWAGLCDSARAQGVGRVPAEPSLGFVLAHADVALNLSTPESDPPGCRWRE